jgi:NADPH2:quinone reductase
VHAAGVNRADLKQRAGNYPMPAGAPSVPGLEVAGVVVRCAAQVTGLKRGDRVCALVVGGGYARYCVAPALQCLPIPDGLDFVAAAALPEATFTVWAALFEQAALKPGETVLIHGGASGIGTTAIQMAKALGSRVLASAGSAAKCRACERLGAEHAINYREEDFARIALEHTGGAGVNVVLDMVGGPYMARNLEALATGGRLCYIAGDAGREASFNIRQVMMKRVSITGSTLRHRTVADKGRIAALLRQHIWPLIEHGRIAPVIDRVLPLENAAEAHRVLEAGEAIGKVVLKAR